MREFMRRVYVCLVEDPYSREFKIDAIFQRKKDADDYVLRTCAATGASKDCFRIERYFVN